MKILVTNRKITWSILMMLVVLGVQTVGYSQAVCQVGDIIQPGESCTYPGTNDVFSVDDAGRARFLFFTAGGNLILRDSNINGKRYTLVTEHSEGGGRRITELGDTTAPPPTAAEPDTGDGTAVVSVVPAEIESPAAGEKLTVNINITGGADVAGYSATLQFDATALRYVESANGDYLPPGAFASPPTLTGNTVTLGAVSLSGATDKKNGVLATITFEVITTKASTLTLSEVVLANSAAESLDLQVESSQIEGVNIGTTPGTTSGTRTITPKVLIAASQRPPMYWIDTDAGTLHRLVGDKVENLAPNVKNVNGLAVDAAGGKLYWTEKTGERTGRIRRATLDGSNPQLVKDLINVPLHLTLDTVGSKLYLISSWGQLQRMNVDGSNFQTNLITGILAPKGLAVDSIGGKVYWIEQTGERTGTIRRANLDGTEVALVKDLTAVPQSIAIDALKGKLYITNGWGKVQRMNLDGSQYESNLITGLTAPMNVAVDAAGGKVYWIESGSLRRASLNGEAIEDVVTGLGSPMGSVPFNLLLPSLSQAQRVSIPDANLAAAIRQEIGNSITTQTLLKLTRLEAPNRGIRNLTGLEHARNLRELNLSAEHIDGEGLVNSNAISDFSPISGLTRLTSLDLSFCGISDVSFLSGLTQLTDLSLWDNSISDISPLARLTQLTDLSLWDNSISDISPLARLTQLTWLDLSDNTMSDISALVELKQLSTLYILDNTISDISPLAELKKLYGLQLDGNTISDISPLAELTGLGWLAIRNNSISDVSPLAKLTKLTDLSLGGNTLSDVSPLAGLTKLTQLDLRNNSISDVSPLVKLNLTGTEWDSTGLNIQGNPLSDASINTHIPAMRAKGIVVAFEGSSVLAQGASGEKIVGPWLWVIAPTGNSGADAAASGIDFLSQMSGGTVTELKIATDGATEGAPVGDSVWTLHKLSPTGGDNINDMVNAAGLGTGDIDNHVAYGSIALEAPRQQQTEMFAGSDDAVKVWLNGELVHNNPVDRGASDFQDQFPVTLKAGPNILLVAVYEGWGAWTGFFGFASDAEYTVTTGEVDFPAWDVNEDGITDATDVILVTAALGQQQPKDPRLDVNGDGVVDAKDLALVVEHLGEGDAPAGPSHPAAALGFTLERVEHTLSILHAADDGTLTFKRGIANLERLLLLFVPEETALLHNYPNPFNPETWIPYQLAESTEVSLHIYAVNGALVRILALGHQPAGVYRIRSRAAHWDGRNAVGEPVASGLYFYTLIAGDFSATRKMLIRK